MEIKTYNSAQLNDLILSEQFAHMPVVPIITHRAISHIRNPRAEADDVLMIIAYENDQMAGYLGVLADRIYNAKGESFKCGWLSCMWVDPLVRGKGIAKQLLATAFKTWNEHILVTEFTPEAKGLYDRSGGFADLRTNEGLRCYLRFNLHEVLPKKNEKYKRYETILSIADAIANIPVELKHRYLPPLKYSILKFEEVKRLYADVNDLITSKSENSFERRNTSDLNWMIEFPWLMQSAPTEESRRYHFSSVASRFQNVFIKITMANRIVGFIHLTIRDNHLKVPYAFFEKENARDVMEYIYDLMFTQGINMLTVFHPELVNYLTENSSPFIYKRAVKRHYIISKVLEAHFADKASLRIQDGDADCAFT
jgi:GNAT superfamily N-acetyltransferase